MNKIIMKMVTRMMKDVIPSGPVITKIKDIIIVMEDM
jgi:hypothetical protein